MKKALLILSILFISILANSQPPIQISELEKVDKMYMKDGKPYSGSCYEKHENGKIAIKGQIKNGKKEGTWTYWYSDGQKRRETNFSENKKEGLTYFWYENGQKQKEIMFKQDKNIDQKLWDEEGNRMPNPTFAATTD